MAEPGNVLAQVNEVFSGQVALQVIMWTVAIVIVFLIVFGLAMYYYVHRILYKWNVDIVVEEGQSRRYKSDKGWLHIDPATGSRFLRLFKMRFDLLNVDSTRHSIGNRITLYQLGDTQLIPLTLKFFYVPLGVGGSGIGGAYWNSDLPADTEWAERALDRLFEKRKKPSTWQQYIPLIIGGIFLLVVCGLMFYTVYMQGNQIQSNKEFAQILANAMKQIQESLVIPQGAT